MLISLFSDFFIHSHIDDQRNSKQVNILMVGSDNTTCMEYKDKISGWKSILKFAILQPKGTQFSLFQEVLEPVTKTWENNFRCLYR